MVKSVWKLKGAAADEVTRIGTAIGLVTPCLRKDT